MAQNLTDVTSQGLGGAFGNFFRETSEDVEGLGRGTAAIPGIVSEYAQETTAAEKAEDVVGFGKGMVGAIAEDPLTFIAESLPIYGQYAAVRDSNMMLDAAKEARERGDEESAINMEALAATAMLGAIPIIGGGLRAGARGARRAGGLETLRTGPEIEQPLSDETAPGIMSVDYDQQGNVIGGAPSPTFNLSARESRYINDFDYDEIEPGRAFESGIASSGVLGAGLKRQSKGKMVALDEFPSFIEGFGLSRTEMNDLINAAPGATKKSRKGNEVIDFQKLEEILPSIDSSFRMFVSGKPNLPNTGYAYTADNAGYKFAQLTNRTDEQRVITLAELDPREINQGAVIGARISSDDADIFKVNNQYHSSFQRMVTSRDEFINDDGTLKTAQEVFDELRANNLDLPDHYKDFVTETLDAIEPDALDAIEKNLKKINVLNMMSRPARDKTLKDLPDDAIRREVLDDFFKQLVVEVGTWGPKEDSHFLSQANLENTPGIPASPVSTAALSLPEDLAVVKKFADTHNLTEMSDWADDTIRQHRLMETDTDEMMDRIRRETDFFNRPRFSHEEFKGRFDRELARLQAEENNTGKVTSYDMEKLDVLPDPVSRVLDRMKDAMFKEQAVYRDYFTYDPEDYSENIQRNIDSVALKYRDAARREEASNPNLQPSSPQGRPSEHSNFRVQDPHSAQATAGFVRTDGTQVLFMPGRQFGPDDIGRDIEVSRVVAEQAINQPAVPWAGLPVAGVLDGRSVLELQNDLRGNAVKDNYGTVEDGKVLRAVSEAVSNLAFEDQVNRNVVNALNLLPKASNAEAILSPSLGAFKALQAPHRLTKRDGRGNITQNVYTRTFNKFMNSPDVNIASLLKEIDNDNANKKGQSPYFKDLRTIEEGLKAIDKLRDSKGYIDQSKVTGEFYDQYLATGAPFIEALTRNRNLYPSLNDQNFDREFVKSPTNMLHYFTDERLNAEVMQTTDPNSSVVISEELGNTLGVMFGDQVDLTVDGYAGEKYKPHRSTYRQGEEVYELFPGYAKDATESQKKLIKAALIDTIRQGNNALVLPGIPMKLNPDFNPDLPDDGGVNPRMIVDEDSMAVTRRTTADEREQDKPQVYTQMWSTAQSLVDQINKDLTAAGLPGRFTAVLAPTGRIDGKLAQLEMLASGPLRQSGPSIVPPGNTGPRPDNQRVVAMRIRPVIYWTPDTQEKLKFRKGGLVTLPGKRYEPGIEAVIRKYRREGMMD